MHKTWRYFTVRDDEGGGGEVVESGRSSETIGALRHHLIGSATGNRRSESRNRHRDLPTASNAVDSSIGWAAGWHIGVLGYRRGRWFCGSGWRHRKALSGSGYPQSARGGVAELLCCGSGDGDDDETSLGLLRDHQADCRKRSIRTSREDTSLYQLQFYQRVAQRRPSFAEHCDWKPLSGFWGSGNGVGGSDGEGCQPLGGRGCASSEESMRRSGAVGDEPAGGTVAPRTEDSCEGIVKDWRVDVWELRVDRRTRQATQTSSRDKVPQLTKSDGETDPALGMTCLMARGVGVWEADAGEGRYGAGASTGTTARAFLLCLLALTHAIPVRLLPRGDETGILLTVLGAGKVSFLYSICPCPPGPPFYDFYVRDLDAALLCNLHCVRMLNLMARQPGKTGRIRISPSLGGFLTSLFASPNWQNGEQWRRRQRWWWRWLLLQFLQQIQIKDATHQVMTLCLF
ncbi:hypothetical protein BC826DRAFT_976628 [Russula brevipes]|nr:hypothetical protein BC826DRAFT_976628 [Russula brevipes]